MRTAYLASSALACAAAAALVGSGCSGGFAGPLGPLGAPPDGPPRRGGELRFASAGDLRTLDPAGPIDGVSTQPIEMLYAGLVDFAPDGAVVPDLAEATHLEDGGRTFVAVLRPNVLFHDGTEVTADDVKRSAERGLRADTPNAFASFYDGIEGVSGFQAGKAPHVAGIEVRGRYQIAFHLRTPDATFPAILAMPSLRPVCKSAGDFYDPSWTACGAGPFKLDVWEKGRAVRLVRHEGYFREGLPYLDAVSWQLGTGLSSQRFRFERGELDVLSELSFGDAIQYLRDPRWDPYRWFEPATVLWGERMDVLQPPFDNVEVRRAVACAIDREQYRLIQSVVVQPETRSLPRGIPFYDESMRGQTYDLPAALRHMANAGYPFDPATGTGGYPRELDYPVYKPSFTFYSGAVLQQALAKIGIRIRLKVTSYATYLSLTAQRGKMAIAPWGWSADYPDASDFYESLFASKSIADDGGSNTSFYSNPTLDRILDDAHGELDPVKRRALYVRANDLVVDEAPWAFTYSYHYFDVKQGYVRGRLEHAMWPRKVTEVWLDRAYPASKREQAFLSPGGRLTQGRRP